MLTEHIDMRTVDSPFEVDGTEFEPEMQLSRPSTVTPLDLADPSVSFNSADDPEDTYNAMRLDGTYLDGSFVQTVVDGRWVFPDKDDIVQSHRYVKLTDLRTETGVYITEERFAELLGVVLFN